MKRKWGTFCSRTHDDICYGQTGYVSEASILYGDEVYFEPDGEDRPFIVKKSDVVCGYEELYQKGL